MYVDRYLRTMGELQSHLVAEMIDWTQGSSNYVFYPGYALCSRVVLALYVPTGPSLYID